MNPIASWIKSNMEPYNHREAKFEDRVAETAINAVKLRDGRQDSRRTSGYWKDKCRVGRNDHFYVAHSTLKATPGGMNSSHQAMTFYNDLGEKKRAAMMAKFRDEAA